MAGSHIRVRKEEINEERMKFPLRILTDILIMIFFFSPDDTAWEGGTFKLELSFNEDYPNKPPSVKFVTKLFHPNVYANGAICLDILQNQWSPIYDIAAILTSIQSLLTDPNPNSPANVEAAKLYQDNRREYDRKVMEFVELSWAEEIIEDEPQTKGKKK